MAPKDDDEPMTRRAGSVPDPDPTILTTRAVDRAIANFRDMMDVKIGGLETATKLLAEAQRTDASLLHAEINRRLEQVTAERLAQRDLLQSQTQQLAAVTNEKFNGIDTRLAEAKVALDAALAAQKDAVAAQNEANSKAIQKSEDSTVKNIDEVKNGITTAIEGLNDKIGDLKSRIDRGEGASTGYATMYTGLVAIGGLMLGLGVLVYNLTK